jgi:tetratricopeptide (TPR) repeat protein
MQCAPIARVARVGALLARVGLGLGIALEMATPTSAEAQESKLDALRAASRANAGDAGAGLAYGHALRRAGRYSEATTELRRAIAYARGPVAVGAHYEVARVFLDQREHGKAMAECRAIAPLPGGAIPSHACAADTHLLWRRASEALLETEQALANGTQSYEAKLAEGLAYELEVKEDAAEQSFRTAIGWQPDRWEGHVWLGRLLLRRLKHDDGVAELKKALALDPDGPEASYELARTMPANADSDLLLHKAINERRNYGAALRRLAEVDVEIGRLPQALAAAETALKADPTDVGSHLVMARVALAEGDLDEAIVEGKAALAIVPNSAPARLIIADADARKGEIDLAVESYEAAYGFDHSDPAPLVRASQACHLAGRETSAKAFGEKATKEFPEWGPGWVAYGDGLAGNKEIASARAAYETALRSRGPVDAASVRAKLAALGTKK